MRLTTEQSTLTSTAIESNDPSIHLHCIAFYLDEITTEQSTLTSTAIESNDPSIHLHCIAVLFR